MTQVSKLGQHILVYSIKEVSRLSEVGILTDKAFHYNRLCFLNIDLHTQDIVDAVANIPKYRLTHYLDKFYLLVPDDIVAHQEILDSFFESTAEEYEALIDVERNLNNIRNLLTILENAKGPLRDTWMIDYGCGTGLSRLVTSGRPYNVIGIDRCQAMRYFAKKRGMQAFSAGYLARKPRNSFDCAFASYVFHLLPDTGGLRLLWSRMRPGAVIVANFHKDQGIELVEDVIRQLHGSVQYLPSPNGSPRHGTYAAYVKPY